MATSVQVHRAESVQNFIALWLAIHGGDPIPDEVKDVAVNLAVYSAASRLANGAELRTVALHGLQKSVGQLGR